MLNSILSFIMYRYCLPGKEVQVSLFGINRTVFVQQPGNMS